MKKFILPFIAILLVSGFVIAQTQKGKKGMPEEVKTYVKENVWPVLTAQREKFDAKLSKKEKEEINTLRTRLEKLREEKQALCPQRKEGPKGQRPELTEAQKEQRFAHQKEMKRIMYSAFQIAENHEAELSAIMDEMKANQEKWRTDLEKLRMENQEERMCGKGCGKGGRKGHGHGRGKGKPHHGQMGHGPRGMHCMQPSEEMFILLDYTQSADDFLNKMK